MTSTFMDGKEPLKQTSTIIFTIARMNPPTPGHLNVIKELIKKGIETNDKIMEEDTNKTKVTDVYIILSKTMDNNENPIPCNEKIDVLGSSDDKTVVDTMIHSLKEEMMTESIEKDKINNINVVCICVDDIKGATPFSQLGSLIYNSYGNVNVDLFLIVGEDRIEMLNSIESVFKNKKYSNVLSIGGNFLIRKDMETYKQLNEDQLREINISEIPRDAFSASFVRKLVKYGLDDQFKNVYLPYLKNEDKIGKLYNSILEGFSRPSPEKKTTKRNAPAKSSTKKNALANKRKKGEDEDEDEDVYEDHNENTHPKRSTRATRSKKETITGGKRKRKNKKTKRLRKH